MSEFSVRLKQLRRDSRMTQAELADKIGVSKSSVNMYERGEREPSFEALEAIADTFNVTMDYLMGRVEASINDKFALFFLRNFGPKDIRHALSEVSDETAIKILDEIQSQQGGINISAYIPKSPHLVRLRNEILDLMDILN